MLAKECMPTCFDSRHATKVRKEKNLVHNVHMVRCMQLGSVMQPHHMHIQVNLLNSVRVNRFDPLDIGKHLQATHPEWSQVSSVIGTGVCIIKKDPARGVLHQPTHHKVIENHMCHECNGCQIYTPQALQSHTRDYSESGTGRLLEGFAQ